MEKNSSDHHRIGPFRPLDIEAVEGTLRRLGISYEIIVDEEERDRKINQHNEVASKSPRSQAGQFDASYIYIAVHENSMDVVGDRLEKFGVAKKSDGSELDAQEFICTRCKYRDYDMHTCVKCQSPTFNVDTEQGQKVIYGNAGAWTPEKIVMAAVLILMLLYAGYNYL